MLSWATVEIPADDYRAKRKLHDIGVGWRFGMILVGKGKLEECGADHTPGLIVEGRTNTRICRMTRKRQCDFWC
ncbi:hypothetical protein EYC84_005692 [Monilinia fructicola]|uniref:Uncharacterized protein n=1 Tax=Monilinia fructicola TaxID=38448 RepID=A0A5M9JXB6_MONFR|nr:hypothetical protein EYC84_005692 [Monilinia fructicola]